MIQLIYVVTAGRPDIHEHLSREFGGEREVRIVLDQRCAERRRNASDHLPERRRADRRVAQPTDRQLQTLGWVLVRTSEAGPRDSVRGT